MDERCWGNAAYYCGSCPTCIQGICPDCVMAHKPEDCFTRDGVLHQELTACGECDLPCETIMTRPCCTVLDKEGLSMEKTDNFGKIKTLPAGAGRRCSCVLSGLSGAGKIISCPDFFIWRQSVKRYWIKDKSELKKASDSAVLERFGSWQIPRQQRTAARTNPSPPINPVRSGPTNGITLPALSRAEAA